jgi:hypothetical protein
MGTLLFLGPTVDGNRDTYQVIEDPDVVVNAMNQGARIVELHDPGDGESVWFRCDAIRYFYEN